jgi:enoyl-CoA hydratase/carnithine racemase
MDLTHVRYETRGLPQGTAAIITLDREDARNAYSDEMLDGLMAAFDAAERDEAVRVVILTGAGRAFSAGGDLKAMRDKTGMFAGGPSELRRRYQRGIHRVPRRLADFDKPVVAAINGAAIGAGLDLACMCDIRVAVEHAKLGSTFVKVGLVPGDGGAYFLARAIGFSRALELVLTGRVFTAEEGHAMGLIHRVVEKDALLECALEVAGAIAGNAPVAVRLAKKAAYRSFDADVETALELAATYQGIAQNTEDHAEAVRAILEKRDPGFTGR